MRCSSWLYEKEYSQPWLFKNYYNLSNMSNFSKRHKILKINWDLYEDFDPLKWPNVKHIGCHYGLQIKNQNNILSNLNQFISVNLKNSTIATYNFELLMDSLKIAPQLTDLNLQSNNINSSRMIVLSKNLNNLKILVLWNNCIGDEGLKYLASALKSNINLEYIDLFRNNIYNIEPMAEALITNNTLTFLDIGGNYIIDIKKLCNALKINKSLKTISLGYNRENIDYEYLADALNFNSTLSELYLFSNGIRKLHPLLIESLKKNTGIVKIQLQFNFIGIDDICEILKINSTITFINLKNNDISDISTLVKVLKNNTSIKKIMLEENNNIPYKDYYNRKESRLIL